jgi:hypothetical protein
LYQNRLDGPVTCHVLVQIFRFVKMFLLEIGQLFPQPLYSSLPSRVAGFSFAFVFRIPDSGFRVSGFVFRVPGFGFPVSGFGCRVPGSVFRIPYSGSRVGADPLTLRSAV